MRLVSPNEMLTAACKEYKLPNPPKNRQGWILVANFVAFNTSTGLEQSILRLFGKIYDIPLAEEYLDEIAEFQARRK